MNRFESWEELPVFNKAKEISDLVDCLVKSVDKTDIEFNEPTRKDMVQNNLDFLSKNANIIPAKIAGAASEDQIYDLRMENAVIIRKAAREIITDLRGIQMQGYRDIEYLDLIRTEIEAFRILFAEWVKTFDKENYIIDRWGLFNPPGINYDDNDPDDDIPFNRDDLFEDL